MTWPNHAPQRIRRGASRLQSLRPVGRVADLGSLGEWSGTSFHSESQRAYEGTTNWGDETIDLDFSDDLSVGTVSSQFVRKEGGKKSQISASAMLGEAEPGC